MILTGPIITDITRMRPTKEGLLTGGMDWDVTLRLEARKAGLLLPSFREQGFRGLRVPRPVKIQAGECVRTPVEISPRSKPVKRIRLHPIHQRGTVLKRIRTERNRSREILQSSASEAYPLKTDLRDPRLRAAIRQGAVLPPAEILLRPRAVPHPREAAGMWTPAVRVQAGPNQAVPAQTAGRGPAVPVQADHDQAVRGPAADRGPVVPAPAAQVRAADRNPAIPAPAAQVRAAAAAAAAGHVRKTQSMVDRTWRWL